MKKRSVGEALNLINIGGEDYKELVGSPDGCIEILRYYLPYCEKRNIPFDKLVQRVDFHFFKIMEELLDREDYEKYGKYLRAYNSLFDKYGIPWDFYSRFRKEKQELDKDYMDIEPSDLELIAISRGVK